VERRTAAARSGLALFGRALSGLNPEGVLARGYALVESGGKRITGVRGVVPGQDVTITLAGGRLDASVTGVREGEVNHGT
jgi:exonuclease VII large subunit